ncbi:MAG: chromosomal replication initiator protein DnaA [Candidatus Omnitrophica bacterium]|nr:chromosomal replication initiator protein DnaA [Candidatus Omnitrophota bacterium]MCF7893706.1 chromosomal replication initiator protein DnaA [Candidatus Omnitrophota bacterium]
MKQDIWENCKKKLKERLGETSFDTWISPLQLKEASKGNLVLEAPDSFFKNWVESNYLSSIEEISQEVEGKKINIEFRVNPGILKSKTTKIFRSFNKSFGEKTQTSLRLNPRFTFDNFVVGSSNRMAHAASLAVARAPGKSYNPIFIYGGVGLGKTHLMQAISNYVLSLNPQTKVKYISSESFANDLILSIRQRNTDKFRKKYRDIDILLIDDIQFLSGKEASQEEFFHTFNVLYDHHKQIVVSSDRPPKEIPDLEERLVSRFNWGLVVDIQTPDYETRVAILEKKLENEAVKVDPQVIRFIAENISSNIRELEGALVRIIAYSLIENKTITVDLAKGILKDMVREISARVTPEIILDKVSCFYGVDKEDLKKAKRSKTLVLPRQVAMYLTRELTESSLPEIGGFFGGKHHTNILYACKKIRKALTKDEKLKTTVNSLAQEIKNL